MPPEATSTPETLRLAVLVSGTGRTLTNLREYIAAGRLRAEVAVVICSNRKSYDIVRNAQPDLDMHLVERKTYDGPPEFSDVVIRLIRNAGANFIVLAGFLSLLEIPDDFDGRIVNTHPALLPAFGGKGMYGNRVHTAVLEAGCKVTGCTVHFADQTYDTGPIILQRACPVRDDDTPDTLAARVFEQECIAYPEALQLFAEGRVRIEGQVTRITTAERDG